MFARLAQSRPAPGADVVARAVGALALAALAVIHVVDLPGTPGPTPLVGFGYFGIIVGAVLAAGMLIAWPRWLAWAAGGAVADLGAAQVSSITLHGLAQVPAPPARHRRSVRRRAPAYQCVPDSAAGRSIPARTDPEGAPAARPPGLGAGEAAPLPAQGAAGPCSHQSRRPVSALDPAASQPEYSALPAEPRSSTIRISR